MQKNFFSILSYLRNKGFFDLLFVNILTQFLGFGSLLLVVKFLNPVELGEVKILQSYTGLFAILAGFGFNTAVLKICAENRSEQEKNGILRLAVTKAGISTAATLLLIIALSLTGLVTTSPHLSLWLIIYACTIPMQVLTNIFIVFLQAQKKIKEVARSQAIIKAQSVLLIILSAWLWGFKGFIYATIIGYAIGLWPFLSQIGLNFLSVRLEHKPAYFMQYALFSVLANGVYLLGQYGDVLILDHFTVNREVIGYYALALIFITAASQVTGTVQSIITPYFSERAQDEVWFRRQLLVNQVRMTFLSVVVAFGVYIFARILISVFYGESYIPVLSYLAILLVKYVIWSSFAVLGPALLGLGLMHYNFIVAAITTPIGLAFTYFLVNQYGVAGAAWGQVWSAFMQLILVLGAVWIAMRRTWRNNQ